MNRLIRKALFLIALTSFPLGEGLFAQSATGATSSFKYVPRTEVATAAAEAETNQLRLGYCVDKLGGTLISQDAAPAEYGAAIYLPATVLNKYVGDKIESVQFSIHPRRGQMAQVFVTRELGGTPISSGVSTSYEDGWNVVKLRTPVTIKADDALYVGYSLVIGAGEAVDCVQFDDGQGGSEQGVNFYGYNGYWYSSDQVPYNICVRALVIGDQVPDNDVSINRIAPVDGTYVEQGSVVGYSAYVRNYGLTPIESITLTAEANGEPAGTQTITGLNIEHNATEKIIFTEANIANEGNFTMRLKVNQVNGVADPDESDNLVRIGGYAYKQGTQPEERTTLFEQFTSEAYEDIPLADALYASRLDQRDDVVWVKHHVSYAGQADKFQLPEEAPYLELYGDGKRFVPAVAVDRQPFTSMTEPGPAYFIDTEDQIEGMIYSSAQVPTFVRLGVQATVEDGTLKASVTGHAGTREMPAQTDLRLTAWLVEDSIHSTTQVGQADYVQNGVIRALLCSNAWGDMLDISGYDFSRDYSLAVDPEWNVENLRVVAFVSNYAQSPLMRRIYNVAQGHVGKPTGIGQVADMQAELWVKAVKGRLTVAPGCRLNAVVDLTGRTVQATAQLPEGVYLAQVTNGQCSAWIKVAVR